MLLLVLQDRVAFPSLVANIAIAHSNGLVRRVPRGAKPTAERRTCKRQGVLGNRSLNRLAERSVDKPAPTLPIISASHSPPPQFRKAVTFA